MPRPGPRRPLVAVRLSDEEIAAVDAIAEARGVTRSDVIRDAVRDAIQKERRDAARIARARERKTER